MSTVRRRAVLALSGGALIISALPVSTIHAQNPPAAPTAIPDIRFQSGQSVVPYLEGWIKNADGTFDFVFGYFNRNTEEELSIPPGPNNQITPGGPDRGQPTYFQTRRQPRVLRVRVPKDWGDKTLTWSITANGRTEKVVSKLLPSEEINERMMIAGGNNTMQFGEEELNKPPTLTVAPTAQASVGTPLAISANVTDDGLPKPPAPPAPRPAAPSNTDPRFQSQRNNSAGRNNVGLRVTWLEYRGPAKVTFDTNPTPVSGGKAVTQAHFAAPGSYTLVATATDGRLTARSETVVTVK